jgi:hypothetical protein
MHETAYAILDKDSSVYPGHPITVAYLITKIFPTFEEAFDSSDSKWNDANALASSKIPGAGGNVSAALSFLRYLRDESLTWDKAVLWADDYWKNCDNQAKGSWRSPNEKGWEPHIDDKPCTPEDYYKNRWRKGQDQADKIKPLLKERDFWWWKV